MLCVIQHFHCHRMHIWAWNNLSLYFVCSFQHHQSTLYDFVFGSFHLLFCDICCCICLLELFVKCETLNRLLFKVKSIWCIKKRKTIITKLHQHQTLSHLFQFEESNDKNTESTISQNNNYFFFFFWWMEIYFFVSFHQNFEKKTETCSSILEFRETQMYLLFLLLLSLILRWFIYFILFFSHNFLFF